MSSPSVDKIFNKESLSSSFGRSGISLNTSSICRCKLSCFLLSPRVLSTVSSPNEVVVTVVFVLEKLKLFCTGGGFDLKCLNVGGDALYVSGCGGLKRWWWWLKMGWW